MANVCGQMPATVSPAELRGRLLQHRPQAVVRQVPQAKFQWIGLRRVRQLVHERFAGENVAVRRQRPIRALPQGRVGAKRTRPVVGNGIGRFQPPARVDVNEVPHDSACRRRPARRGSRSVPPGGNRPSELLVARPAQETGLPAARAKWAASIAASPVCFPPKPPPVSGTITWTFSRTRSSRRPLHCGRRKGSGCPSRR